MRNLADFALRQEYERVKDLGDKLVDIGGRLNWESFRPTLESMYRNNTECGGRPNLDVIVVLKSLFITADPGHAKADTPRGIESKTRRSKDGTWAKMGTKSLFGYKLHDCMDDKFVFSDSDSVMDRSAVGLRVKCLQARPDAMPWPGRL